jgi:hypothetical protein
LDAIEITFRRLYKLDQIIDMQLRRLIADRVYLDMPDGIEKNNLTEEWFNMLSSADTWIMQREQSEDPEVAQIVRLEQARYDNFRNSVLVFDNSRFKSSGYKTSFHFIVNGYVIGSKLESKHFAERVKKCIQELTESRFNIGLARGVVDEDSGLIAHKPVFVDHTGLKRFGVEDALDLAIYNKNHAIRVYGAAKFGEDVPKQCERNISFGDSLVTCSVVGHSQLPTINVAAINAQKAKNVELRKTIDKRNKDKYDRDQANMHVKFTPEKINEMLGSNKMMKSRFECTGVNNKNFCQLTRIDSSPYYCECCRREHENQERVWPWVLVSKGKLMVGCQRNDKKSYIFIEPVE